jgi:signal transduction histidine kinase
VVTAHGGAPAGKAAGKDRARVSVASQPRRPLLSPLAVAWLPVVVIPPILIVDALLEQAGKPLTVVNVACAFVVCLPLVWRARLNVVALVALVIAGVILVMALLHPGQTVVVMPMVALFELALRGDRRRSWWCALVTVPGVLAGVLPFAAGAGHIAFLVARNLAFCLFAIAAGDVLRSRATAAQQAVEAREQETLRRVADERLRIAQEIHDVVAHAMTAINVQAGVAAHLLQRDPGQAHGALRDIKRVSGEALDELRSTLEVLRDPGQGAALTPTGDLGDLEHLAAGLRAAGVQVAVDVGELGEIAPAVGHAGYRIVQEALTNVARHSGAASARVDVRRDDGSLAIEVSDDGCGAGDALPGNGVSGMRERVRALGGAMTTGPGEDGGWVVTVRLP